MKVSLKKATTTETVTMPDGSKMAREINTPDQLVAYNESSIGALVDDINSKLKADDRNELISLIKSRFEGGEMGGNELLQNARNIGYIGVMGHYMNAITQMGDLWKTIRRRPGSFLKGMKKALPMNDDSIDAVDLGINRALEEHASDPMWTARALDTIFTHSCLKNFDKFGKDTFLNAAWDDFTKIATGKSSKKKFNKFVEKHNELFGEDFTAKLLEDLKAGKRSFETDAALFSDISDAMPISKSEMPQGYLDSPNGRIAYQLKTFTLKVMDEIRREGIDRIADAVDLAKAGDKVGASKVAAEGVMKIGLIGMGGAAFEAGTSDVIKDFIRGKPVSADTVYDGTIVNMQRMIFMNKHITKRFGEKGSGGLLSFISGVAIPPVVSLFDQATHDFMLMLDGDLSLDSASLTYAIPLVGDAYWWNYTEAGQKRTKEIKEEIEQGKDPLFVDIADAQKGATRNAKNMKGMVDGHIMHLEDLRTDADRNTYLHKLKKTNPLEFQKTFRKFKKNRANGIRGLSENEIAFKRRSAEVRAVQLSKIINGLSGRRQKQAYYQDMIRKGIINRSVKRQLDVLLK